MRFLILDTYYPQFLEAVYRDHPGMASNAYAEQLSDLLLRAFGTSDFYSSNLRRLGHPCDDIIGNCDPLQLQWCREHRPDLARAYILEVQLGKQNRWRNAVLAAQVEMYEPDVLYIQDLNWYDAQWLDAVKNRLRPVIVGQTASQLMPDLDCSPYDLILTSFPHYVSMFRSWGVCAKYVSLAFEATMLDRVGNVPKEYGLVFVGSYASSGQHASGTELLERVVPQVGADCWGTGVESLAPASPIRHSYRGEAWGLDMYRIYARSRVVLNRHAPIQYRYANNMRLYETTGMGAMLLTDAKDNLHELFDVGTEVVPYHDASECAELAKYYLEHEEQRAAIAAAGQARTLREHTYFDRMRAVVDLVNQAATRRTVFSSSSVMVNDSGKRRADAASVAWSYRPGGHLLVPQYLRARKALVRAGRISRRAGRVLRRMFRAPAQSGVENTTPAVSRDYEPVVAENVDTVLAKNWQSKGIAANQRQLVDSELSRMYQGNIVAPFAAAASAMRATNFASGTLVEVGSGSGYYAEVLRHLLDSNFNYIGVDYSGAMLALGRHYYPETRFVAADARQLCFADNSIDVVLSGGVMLHVPEYLDVLRETVRVARQWCIFHRTPVSAERETRCFTKLAYGSQVLEYVFSERELFDLFEKHGLFVRCEFLIEERPAARETPRTLTKTFVCRKADSHVCVAPDINDD